jgi:hypothetical protein
MSNISNETKLGSMEERKLSKLAIIKNFFAERPARPLSQTEIMEGLKDQLTGEHAVTPMQLENLLCELATETKSKKDGEILEPAFLTIRRGKPTVYSKA